MRSTLSDNGWCQVILKKIQLPLIYSEIFAEHRGDGRIVILSI
jgi:hypothetical protein